MFSWSFIGKQPAFRFQCWCFYFSPPHKRINQGETIRTNWNSCFQLDGSIIGPSMQSWKDNLPHETWSLEHDPFRFGCFFWGGEIPQEKNINSPFTGRMSQSNPFDQP